MKNVYFIGFLFSLFFQGNSQLTNDNNLLENINDNESILLTYQTAIALYGIDYANNLQLKKLLIQPDDPVLAYVTDVSSANIRLWSSQSDTIPYQVQDSNVANIVDISIKNFESLTTLRFKKRTNERNYIYFSNSGNCGGLSFVGMIGGGQRVSIPSIQNCFNSETIAKGVVQHEIMHALGFSHQQSYPNRDNYVRILTQNIQNDAVFNFKKRNPNIIDSFDYPYDYKSIMHYRSNTFSKNGNPTITKLDGSIPNGNFGGSVLTVIDISKINDLYPNINNPTRLPIQLPTLRPTFRITNFPSLVPTLDPTTDPRNPTKRPTVFPTSYPTNKPTFQLTNKPTFRPTNNPSFRNSKCYVKGDECVFPFIFRGNKYNGCTTEYDFDNKAWCSTKVNSNGEHIRGNWGYCSCSCNILK